MQELIQLLQTFGLAVTILGVLGFALWRTLVWLRPWAEKLIQAHIDLVLATTSTIGKLSTIQENQQVTLEQIAATQGQIAQTQEKQVEMQSDQGKQIEALAKAVEVMNHISQRQILQDSPSSQSART